MAESGKYDHISSGEIERDISETEREIEVMRQELIAFEKFPIGSRDYLGMNIHASARRSGIAERKEFVVKLKGILADRKIKGEMAT